MPDPQSRPDAAAAPPSGVLGEGRHVFVLRVYYEDTDAAGIVYYANYLKFMERARTEMMRLLGFEHSTLRETLGINWAVRRCVIDYRLPARLDDRLEVESRIAKLGGAALDIEQTVSRDGTMLATATLQLVCMHPDGRPARLPATLRQRLAEAGIAALPPHSSRK